jgi:hypothetical protein
MRERLWVATVALFAILCVTALAATLSPTAVPLTGSAFEGGDTGVPTAQAAGLETAQKSNGAGARDWFDYSSAAGGAQIPGLRTVDDIDTQDSEFAAGKHEVSPGSWDFITQAGGVTPAKNNIRVAWAVVDPTVAGTFLYAGLKRQASNGTTALTVELNQVDLPWDPDAANPSNALIPCRTSGDLLVDVGVPGATFDVTPYLWTTSTSTTVVDPGGVSHACARTGTITAVNSSPVTDAEGSANWNQGTWDGTVNNYLLPGTYGSTFAAGLFAEVALNVTNILAGAPGGNPCAGFASLQVHSRSFTGSPSIATDTLADLVGPVPLALRSCGVTGFVFNDLDGNGVWNTPTEPGLAGWTVYADLNDNGQRDAGEPFDVSAPAPATPADAPLGSYDVGGVTPAGDHRIRELPPGGADPNWTCTSPTLDPSLPGNNSKLKCGRVVTFTQGTRSTDKNGNPANFGDHLASPTAVGLTSFTASRVGRSARVTWRTASDARVAIYRIYREQNGARHFVHELEPAGRLVGARHSWLDRNAPGGRVRYWLERVDLSGEQCWYGPASVR